jgi:transcriptional regulator with XRE-family HTH domain
MTDGPPPDPQIGLTLSGLLRRSRAARTVEAAHAAADAAGYRPPPLGTLRGPRHHAGVSQEQVAALLGGYSDRQYRSWEAGRRLMPHAVADRLVVVLGLDEAAVGWLRSLLTPSRPGPVPADIPPVLLAAVHSLPWPAYVAGPTWDVLAANAAYHSLFPWAAPAAPHPAPNVVRATLLRPEAREVLVNWLEDWALPLWRIVWSTYQVTPQDAALTALVVDIAASEQTAQLWEQRDAPAGPRLYQAAARRQVRHPEHGVMDVAALVTTPEALRPAGVRLMGLVPAVVIDQVPEWEAGAAAMGRDLS